MGTAGLDLKRLSGLLERLKVNCTLIDDDRAQDHCVLRLSSFKRPGVVAFVQYENAGSEPRLVGMVLRPANFEFNAPSGNSFDWDKTIKLAGPRKNDPELLAHWVEREFLN